MVKMAAMVSSLLLYIVLSFDFIHSIPKLLSGLDGLNGREPPNSTQVDYLEMLGFPSRLEKERHGLTRIVYHHFYGFVGKRGTDGGNGGCGALGGNEGKTMIFGFPNTTNFEIFGENGKFTHLN